MKFIRLNGVLYRVADNPKKRRKTKKRSHHAAKRGLKHHAKEAARESVSGALAMVLGIVVIGALGWSVKA